jgi:hypothetical protein
MQYTRAALELAMHVVAWACFLVILALLFTA